MKKNLLSFFSISYKTKNNNGFTVVELLISIAVVSLIVGALGIFQADTFKKDRAFRARLIAVQEARLMLRRFLEEVRSASQSSNGTYAISLAQSDAMTLYSDSDGDNIKDRVRYFVSGNQLKKGILVPTGSPLDYVPANEKIFTQISSLASTTEIFTFYDTNNATMTSPATPILVRSVKINVLINLDRQGNAATGTVPFTTIGTFRNLKDNY